MRNFTLLALVLFLSSTLAFSQQTKYTGSVQATHKPVQEVLVLLRYVKNNSPYKSAITDSLGNFQFIISKKDSFYIDASLQGYKKYRSEVFYINLEDTAISQFISLEEAVIQNEEVTVNARLPFVQRRIDRTIISPDALISNAGTTALEVLEKSPGVLVDANGNISLHGKGGVIVFIDDKPTYMSSADLSNYLRGLPSSSIATIEIMTNPPAKYDAAGNAGIINIKLKRTAVKGWNGNISLAQGQGTYARSNNSANVNYRVNKINMSANIGQSYTGTYQDLFINRTYLKPNGSLNGAFDQNSFIKKQIQGYNVKLGLDYYITKKSIFGFVLSGFNNINKTTITNTAQIYNESMVLQNNVTAYNPSKRNFRNGSVNLNYNYKLNKKGAELLLNADYIKYRSVMKQSLLNTLYLPDGSFDSKTNLVSNLPADIAIYSFKADYTAPLKNNAKAEAGIKTSKVNTDNIADFFDENSNVFTPNYDFSNNFRYNENINAVYVNYSQQKKRFGLQIGLRLENTIMQGNQLGNPVRNDSSFKRTYTNLFPTMFLQYNLDSAAHNVVGFSFGRRLNRPDYQSLNPFTYPLDRYTLYGGNPFLEPTFSYNFELTHTYKNWLTTSLKYSFAENEISETIEQGTNIFYSRPGNFGKRVSYGASVNINYKLTKWWTLQWYNEVQYNSFTGSIYNQTLNNKGTYWVSAPTNMFQINKNWTAELSGTYQTSLYIGQFVTVPVLTMRTAVSKKIWKEKGILKAALNDALYTNQPGGTIQAIGNSTAKWKSYLDTRVLVVQLSYRFNKGKSLQARQAGASDTEKSRVK
jgi:iron complex outermembrane receptor protein